MKKRLCCADFLCTIDDTNCRGDALIRSYHEYAARILRILPLFAFVNSGIDLRGISLDQLVTPVPLGIMLGLFLGKQAGVFLFSSAAIRLKLAILLGSLLSGIAGYLVLRAAGDPARS